MSGKPRLEVRCKDVAYSQAVAAGLVHVGGTYALEGGAYLGLALGCLGRRVDNPVGRGYEVGFLGDPDALPYRYAGLLQLCAFFFENDRVQHHSVADKVVSAGPEYAGRYGVKHEALVSGLYGMAGVGSALEAGYDAVSPGKYVHYLAFSLVSPLEAEYYVYFCSIFVHVCHQVQMS